MAGNYLTVRELAKELKASTSTIYRLVRTNQIPYIRKKGLGLRFDFEAIQRWLKKDNFEPLDLNLSIIYTKGDERKEAVPMAKFHFGTVRPYQTKDGRVRWLLDFRINGKRYRKVAKLATTKNEALVALQAEISKIFNQVHSPNESKPISFESFSQIYLDWARVNKKSWKSDFYYQKHYLKAFRGKMLNEITIFDVEAFKMKRLKEGVEQSTVNRNIQILRKMFSMAVKWNYLKSNPCSGVKLFSEEGRERTRVLTFQEEVELFKHAPEHLKPIIICGLQTGMRKGEILNLKWENVDLKRRLILVKGTKTNKNRVIPISDILYEELLKLKGNGSEFVFPNPDTGKPFKDIKRSFNTAVKKAGLKGVVFYTLRHTFATRGAQVMDITTLKELLGHSNLRTTQRYCHPSLDSKREGIRRLAEFGQLEKAVFVDHLQKGVYKS